MKHDEFIGQVQHHARLSSRGDAELATRATLETLAERLAGGEAKDLACCSGLVCGYANAVERKAEIWLPG